MVLMVFAGLAERLSNTSTATCCNTWNTSICSERSPVTSGTPQRTILETILLLIYINDITNDITSKAKLYPDDT